MDNAYLSNKRYNAYCVKKHLSDSKSPKQNLPIRSNEKMQTKLIVLKNEKLYVSTSIISKKCDVEHRSILRLINTHKKDIEDFGILISDKEKIPKGRPLNVFLLNEEQFTFLITLMQNSKVTVSAKKLITKEFFRMRTQLLQIKVNKQNEEWLKERNNGKKARKEFTDILNDLLEFTKENNPESTYSKKPNLLFSNFTRMIYKNLFDFTVKPNKVRDSMNERQLYFLGVAELAAQKSIQDGLNENKDAKEIYKLTNEKINKYAEIIGKTTIIDLITNNQVDINNLLENKND